MYFSFPSLTVSFIVPKQNDVEILRLRTKYGTEFIVSQGTFSFESFSHLKGAVGEFTMVCIQDCTEEAMQRTRDRLQALEEEKGGAAGEEKNKA